MGEQTRLVIYPCFWRVTHMLLRQREGPMSQSRWNVSFFRTWECIFIGLCTSFLLNQHSAGANPKTLTTYCMPPSDPKPLLLRSLNTGTRSIVRDTNAASPLSTSSLRSQVALGH